MSTNSVNITIEKLRGQCREIGFDLVQPFRVQSYNIDKDADSRIPEFGRDQTLGALIGNTGFLWNYFLRHLAQQPGLLREKHPLDSYVTQEINRVLAQVPPKTEVRFSYEKAPRFVSLQSVCELSGLAPLKAGMLNVHPIYGPWIALRAVISFDLSAEGMDNPSPPKVPSGWEDDCHAAFQEACDAAGDSLDHLAVKASWKRWLKVRDACPVGKEHRYSEEQILYHYTQDREILRRAIASIG